MDNKIKKESNLRISAFPRLRVAVCLVSGGMDSCVTAAIAKEETGEIAFLHVSYGQLTEKRERKAFNDIADFLQH